MPRAKKATKKQAPVAVDVSSALLAAEDDSAEEEEVEQYEVENILSDRTVDSGLQYLVKWVRRF